MRNGSGGERTVHLSQLAAERGDDEVAFELHELLVVHVPLAV